MKFVIAMFFRIQSEDEIRIQFENWYIDDFRLNTQRIFNESSAM